MIEEAEEEKEQSPLKLKMGKSTINCVVVPEDRLMGDIYIGDINSAFNIKKLKELKILAVLTVADYPNLGFSIKINHLMIPAKDEINYNLRAHFKRGTRFMRTNLRKGNVLIHSMAGVSRSGAMVVAYLMKYHFMTLEDSMRIVLKRRFVKPNPGFKRQLMDYEKYLQVSSKYLKK